MREQMSKSVLGVYKKNNNTGILHHFGMTAIPTHLTLRMLTQHRASRCAPWYYHVSLRRSPDAGAVSCQSLNMTSQV